MGVDCRSFRLHPGGRQSIGTPRQVRVDRRERAFPSPTSTRERPDGLNRHVVSHRVVRHAVGDSTSFFRPRNRASASAVTCLTASSGDPAAASTSAPRLGHRARRLLGDARRGTDDVAATFEDQAQAKRDGGSQRAASVPAGARNRRGTRRESRRRRLRPNLSPSSPASSL